MFVAGGVLLIFLLIYGAKILKLIFLFFPNDHHKITVQVLQTEAVVGRCPVKKMFLKFIKIYRKTPVTESLS